MDHQDRERLTHILHTIAEREIPNDMDRSREIHAAIGAKQSSMTRQRQMIRQVALVAILLMLLLMSGIIAYAAIRALQGDPGLEGAESQGLVQVIDESQTIEGVTVTVEKAYMDANRIAVWYTIADLVLPEGEVHGNYINLGVHHPADLSRLNTGATSGVVDTLEDGSFSGLITIDHQEPVPENGIYEIVFRVEIGGENAWVYVFPPGEPFQGPPPEEYRYEMPYVGPFDFTLALNASEPVELTPDETQVSNDVPMTLKLLRITPSQTVVQVCYTMPNAQDWQPNMTVMIDDEEGLPAGYSVMGGKAALAPDILDRCVEMNFLVAYAPDSERITILIDRLHTSVPEPSPDVLAMTKTRLAEIGIVIEFIMENHGMRWEIIDAPDDMTETEVGDAVWEAMRERYEGEWRFEITLPQR